jgi:hypothetical protein
MTGSTAVVKPVRDMTKEVKTLEKKLQDETPLEPANGEVVDVSQAAIFIRRLRHHRYVIVTGAVAVGGTAVAVLVDLFGFRGLQHLPITTNVIATALGVAWPVFIGSLFFDRWKVVEDQRRIRRAMQEETLRQKITQLVEILSPCIARARIQLQHIVLIHSCDTSDVSDALRALEGVLHDCPNGLAVTDSAIPIGGITELYGFATALPRLRDAIDALDEALDVGGNLGGTKLGEAVDRVRPTIEKFHRAVPVGLERDVARLKTFIDERVGLWDGEMVRTPNGSSYRVKLSWLQRLGQAAQKLTEISAELEQATSALKEAADQELQAYGAAIGPG